MAALTDPARLDDEDVRRAEIDRYAVLATPTLSALEGLVRVAVSICGTSAGVLNIIDETTQHQIAAVGIAAAACARSDSMCAIVLGERAQVVVPDARADARFAENPFVTGAIGSVRLYASSPLITPSGVSLGTLCVFDDVEGELDDAQREALDVLARHVVDALELRRLASELSETNLSLTRFAGRVSHDLRNPLTAVTGFIDLALMSGELDDAPFATSALERAVSASERMAQTIASLLANARAGAAAIERENVAIGDLVDDVSVDVDAEISAHSAVVSVRGDRAATVWADRTLLRILVQNAVANALKFTAATGCAPRVEVGLEPSASGILLTIDDNGPGIAPEDRERVFEALERAATAEIPGLGVGLSTCRTVAEAHGGTIRIEDSPLGGARVAVELPAG